MAVEKNMPWGRKLSHPLGAVLVACGALAAAVNFREPVCAGAFAVPSIVIYRREVMSE